MKGDSQTATLMSALREEAARSPESPEARWKLGTALLRVGFLTQGEQELERALELDPNMVKAWVNLGGARLSRWDFRGCIEANRRAIECSPDLVQAHFNQGLGHLYLGEVAETIRCFERVVELDPDLAAGHYHLAVGLRAAGRVPEARQELARAMIRGHSPDPDFIRELEKSDDGSSPALIMEFGGARPGEEDSEVDEPR